MCWSSFIKKLLLIFILIILGAAGGVYYCLYIPADGAENQTDIFDVKPGTTLKKLSGDLKKAGLISSEAIFYYYIRAMHRNQKIRAGEYSLKPSSSAIEIWGIISSGHGVDRSFTVKEGMNTYEIAQKFAADGLGSSEEFLKHAFDKNFVNEILKIDAPSFEGYLFPETYKVSKYIGAKDFIILMAKQAQKTLTQVRGEFPTKMPISQQVTMASIIEKETGAPGERRIISSVIYNRLNKGMKLQMDPTVIYGYWRKTGHYIENIHKQDLLEPNEYNTYTFYGLPAGPISNPGKESMSAAANPEKSGFLYFVSKNDGTHTFSETLKDHNKAVGKFQLDKSAREGKSWRDLKKKKKKSASKS